MRTKLLFLLLGIFLAHIESSDAQIYDTNNAVVQTFAGSGFFGYLDGTGVLTMFNDPATIVADSSSNLFVWDSNNDRIRKITPDSVVTTFAGGGAGSLPGYGTNVSLGQFTGWMFVDHSNAIWGTAWTASSANIYFLHIRADGLVSKVSTNLTGLHVSGGVCQDSVGNIYYAGTAANKIFRWLTNGITEVFVGSGNIGSVDGNGVFTSFSSPTALAIDGADNIHVWDSGSRKIRRINQNRDVVTVTGGSATSADGPSPAFGTVSAMFVDNAGNLILTCGTSIRKMTVTTNGVTLAGSFTQPGYTNGPNNLARFSGASGACMVGGSIFVADTLNQRVRQITFGQQPQVVAGANLGIGTYAGVTITGIVGRTYQIQSSADLISWNIETTIVLPSSPYLWIDRSGLGGKRFYRALLLP